MTIKKTIKVKLTNLLLGCCLLLANAATAQKEMDKTDYEIALYLQKITHLSQIYKDPYGDNDSLVRLNSKLLAYMQTICKEPATLNASFSRAEDAGMIVQSSTDKKIRFYAWDTWIGNTMHYFDLLVQYQAGSETKSLVLNDIAIKKDGMRNPGSFPTDVTTVQTKDGNTVYMMSDCSVASDNYKANGLKAYTIEDGKLKTVSFFETTKEPADNIDYLFNASYDSTNFNPGIIHFSDDKKKLFVPFVANNGKLSKEFLIYNFNGYKYVLNKKQRKMVEEER